MIVKCKKKKWFKKKKSKKRIQKKCWHSFSKEELPTSFSECDKYNATCSIIHNRRRSWCFFFVVRICSCSILHHFLSSSFPPIIQLRHALSAMMPPGPRSDFIRLYLPIFELQPSCARVPRRMSGLCTPLQMLHFSAKHSSRSDSRSNVMVLQ